MNTTPPKTRLVLAMLAGAVGLFMVTAAPILIQVSVGRVLAALMKFSIEKPGCIPCTQHA